MSQRVDEAVMNVVVRITGTDRPIRWTMGVGLFCLSLVARVGYWMVSGTVTGPSSRNFVAFCTAVLADPGSLPAVIDSATVVGTTAYWLLYTGYWAPMCGVYTLTGGSLDLIVLCQIIASSLTPVLLFLTADRRVDLTAAAVSGLAMAVLLDTFVWSTRILTDSPFVFVLALTLWQLARYHDDPTGQNRALVWGCFLWLSITRPNGIVLVLGWLGYDLLPIDERFNLFPYRSIAIVGAVVALPVVAFVVVPGALTFVTESWQTGVVVANDPAFTYAFTPRGDSTGIGFIVANVDHVAILAVLKVLVFFLPVVERFSFLHNAINVVTLLPVTLASFVGVYRAVRNRSTLARDWVTPYALLVVIIAGTHVDYSWGYRAPVTVLMVLLSGYAVSESRIGVALSDHAADAWNRLMSGPAGRGKPN